MRSTTHGAKMATVGEDLRQDDPRPRIVVVDDDLDDLALLENEIGSRYARDYVVVARSSPVEAMTVVERSRAADQRVAAVLASQWMDEMDGSQLLRAAGCSTPEPSERSSSRRGTGGKPGPPTPSAPPSRAVASTPTL